MEDWIGWTGTLSEKSHAMGLTKAVESAPRVSWSASGYARGLRSFILDRVTAIHAVEFSVYKPGYGFAGTADALLDIDGDGPFIVDWKTAKKSVQMT